MLPKVGSGTPKYPKILCKPQPFRAEGWNSLNNQKRWEAEDRKIEQEGLSILLKHFGIPLKSPDRWRQLTLKLVQSHLSYFTRETSRKGPKKAWDEFGLSRLLRRVAEQRQKGKSDQEALTAVNRKHYGVPLRTLQNQLNVARRHPMIMALLVDTRAVSLVGRDKMKERLWRRFSVDSPDLRGVVVPDPDNPDGVMLFDDSTSRS